MKSSNKKTFDIIFLFFSPTNSNWFSGKSSQNSSSNRGHDKRNSEILPRRKESKLYCNLRSWRNGPSRLSKHTRLGCFKESKFNMEWRKCTFFQNLKMNYILLVNISNYIIKIFQIWKKNQSKNVKFILLPNFFLNC